MRSSLGTFLLSTVERSTWTFIQTFLGLIVIEHNVSWVAALIASGIAAAKALSLGLSSWNQAPTQLSTSWRALITDTVERTVSTFVQSFIGTVISLHSFSVDALSAALVAAGIAAVKCVGVVLAATNPNSTLPLASDSSPPAGK